MSARGGGKKKGAKKKAPSWQCNWCQTSKTSKHHRGPDGPNTLCDKCSARNRRGETGPRSDDWECDWCGVEETQRRCKGPKGPGTLCEPCHGRRANGATGPSKIRTHGGPAAPWPWTPRRITPWTS